MKQKTNEIWYEFYTEIFFFILKRVKNEDSTNDIIQNSFIKIHENLNTLKQNSKLKSWVFQIVRNEVANFYKGNKGVEEISDLETDTSLSQVNYDNLCCFDRFINELPEKYKTVVDLIYFQGKNQFETAELLGISLANVKARILRAKNMITQKLKTCCKFSTDKKGRLIGESNCSICKQI